MTSSPRPPLIVRAFARLWTLLKSEDPLAAVVATASERGDFLPAHWISTAYLAWQTAVIPRWDASAGRHAASFSPRAFLKGLRPARETAFHEVRPRQSAPPGSPAILHAIPSLAIGGSEKIVFDLVEGLGDRFRMRVLTGRLVRHAPYAGLDVAVRESAEEIAEEIRRDPPALIHLHYWGPHPWTTAYLAALDLLDLKIPVVGNMNNPIPPLDHPRLTHHVFVSRFAAVIDSRWTRPSSVIYPGSAPEIWAPDARRAREPFPVAGMVYRLSPEKLDLESVDALIEIAVKLPQTRFLIPGGGPLLPEFVARVARAGVRANFHFLGWIAFRDLPSYYDRLDLYLAPLTTESFGVVVPYAMFKGVPVLATDIGALPEILVDERWLCSRKDFAARAVEMLRRHDATRTAAAALIPSARRFSLSEMLSSYEALYRRLLS